MKRNQNGFSAIEVVLVLVIVCLIGVVGWMTYQNHKENKSAKSNTSASAKQQPKKEQTTKPSESTKRSSVPTLDQAVEATKAVYDAWAPQSARRTETRFIQENPSLFTAAYVQSLTNGSQGHPLECDADATVLPDSTDYTGVSVTGTTALVTAVQHYQGQGNSYTITNHVKLSAENGKWLFDGLNCPSEQKG